MEEINLFLNSMEIEELETLKDIINSRIEIKKKEERKGKYTNAIKNILKEINVITNECSMCDNTAMIIDEYEYSGQDEDIEMSWGDLQCLLFNYLTKKGEI